jgi:hypothetical protein
MLLSNQARGGVVLPRMYALARRFVAHADENTLSS